ncbi:MAG: STAS domain-containing protein [Actinomycetota bacterium]|nr:STAS domain-containing protein [Actinomycetota bacterium]
MNQHLSCSTASSGTVAVITCAGEIDMSTADALRDELNAAVQSTATAVLVDLTGVTFMDSTGLGLLAKSHTRAVERGSVIRLVGPIPHVAKVMHITQLDQVLPVHATLDEALAAAASEITFPT